MRRTSQWTVILKVAQSYQYTHLFPQRCNVMSKKQWTLHFVTTKQPTYFRNWWYLLDVISLRQKSYTGEKWRQLCIFLFLLSSEKIKNKNLLSKHFTTSCHYSKCETLAYFLLQVHSSSKRYWKLFPLSGLISQSTENKQDSLGTIPMSS